MSQNIYITLEGGSALEYSQARSMSRCFEAYALECEGENIEDMEYVPHSNTFYILLQNSICISSTDGNRVEYSIGDSSNGRSKIWSIYEEALSEVMAKV